MRFYRLNKAQRELWADKLMDLANFSLAALVFGQATTANPKLELVSLGVSLYVVAGVIATYLGR